MADVLLLHLVELLADLRVVRAREGARLVLVLLLRGLELYVAFVRNHLRRVGGSEARLFAELVVV